jgi:signal transduction histidine kinase
LSFETHETLDWPIRVFGAKLALMLIHDRLTPRAALSSALLWGMAPATPRAMSWREPVAAERSEREARAPELAPTLTRDVVRAVAASAIGVNIALSLIDVWRLVYVPVQPEAFRAAVVAATLAIPLHIRHVIFGLRGERPPAGIWTLAALAIINAVAFVFVGQPWIFQFASLTVSILIILPGAVGLVLATAVVVSPLLLVGTQWHAVLPNYAGVYLAFAITWRSATQFVPLRLMAAIRALDVAGGELETRAVVQARVRIDGELRAGVASALQQIVARGDAAREAVDTDPPLAKAELRQLVYDSRRALSQARRVVAGYRNSSVRAELDAAAALLEASGASVRIVTAPGLALDSPDENARQAIRTALASALREEPNASYCLEVARDSAGALSVSVSSAGASVDGAATGGGS